MTLEELVSISAKNGLTLDSHQVAMLAKYAELLRKQNEVVNLISRKDEENILSRHILHSLVVAMPSVAGYEFAMNARVFDIGTGGGLPGIPLAVVRSDLDLTLCDSIGKKITAVRTMIAELGLTNATAIVSRAEDLVKDASYRSSFDVVVSRAVAPLSDLVHWTRGLLAPHGVLLSLKGGDLREETERVRKMKDVASVTERSLALEGYDDFVTEEKRIVRVTFAS